MKIKHKKQKLERKISKTITGKHDKHACTGSTQLLHVGFQSEFWHLVHDLSISKAKKKK